MKLGIALPHTHSHYHRLFVQSFFCIIRPENAVLLIPNSDGPLDGVRNELCQQALIHGCDHIWWCDTDQVYPPDVLVKLIDRNLPIVCAKVHRRKPPYDPLLKRLNKNRKKDDPFYIDIKYDEWALRNKPDELIEVDATGFGCNLMAIEVIEKMSKPWFKFNLYPKDRNEPIGEDFYFWNKAKNLGYKIFVDCSINIGHIADAVVDGRTYKSYRNHMSMG